MSKELTKFLTDDVGLETSVGDFIKTIRLTEFETMSQKAFAEDILNVSKSRLSDIENARVTVNIKTAIDIANKIGHSKRFLVSLAIEEMLKKQNLNYKVSLEPKPA